MKSFQLQIVTPAGPFYNGTCTQLSVPAVDGEVGILADHIPLVTALKKGGVKVYTEGGVREGSCSGGMLTVSRQAVRVLASDFQWKE
jgi:F-type H+-transporting ATPase subunit epsilon